MKKIRYEFKIMLLMMIIVSLLSISGEKTSAADKIKVPENVIVKQSGKSALKIKWEKVKGATGYEIYKTQICLGGYKRVKTIKNKLSWKDITVGTGKTGTYKVRAYKINKGKKIRSKYSYPVSAKVCRKKDKKRNVAEVKIIHKKGYKGDFTLGYGESIIKEYDKFRVKVHGPEKKGGLETWTPINKRLRWFSSDPSIVRVKSATDIRANNKKGKCYIYAVAHNGVRSKKIPVVVKDFAYEKVDIKYAPGRTQILFEEFENEIREICSYYSIRRNGGQYLLRYFEGEPAEESGALRDKTKLSLIKKVLEDAPFETIQIMVTDYQIEFKIFGEYVYESLVFVFGKWKAVTSRAKNISPHWWYGKLLVI